jgi:MSHA biogenesis protein MshK
MAKYLNFCSQASVTPKMIAGAWFFCAFVALSSASAETLTDPTRPPAGFGQNVVQSEDFSAPQLQSILISPIRRIAIISGKALKAGDKFGDAQLVAISENEVVLRSGKVWKVLKLYPSLRKQETNAHVENNLDSPSKGR